MPMTVLPWFILALCLLSGGIMLKAGLRDFLQVHMVAQRFRQHVAAGPRSPRLGDAGRDMLERIGRKVAGEGQVGAVQQLLFQAGLSGAASPFIFMSLRLLATLVAAGLAVLPVWLRHGALAPKNAVLAFFLGLFVYRGFSILLKLRVEARQRAIRRELPYVLDLVLMVLESGISIDQALHHVRSQIGTVAPVTGELLTVYIAETDEGMPYEKALDRLALRLAIPEGRDFAGLLKQNLLQGGEIGPPLRRLAGDINDTRLARAREQMGKKSVLLTAVMLFFFMPVLMVALAGPAVSDLSGTLGTVAHKMKTMKARR
jgi:tight adherence protein C